jgi:hypothetical protein
MGFLFNVIAAASTTALSSVSAEGLKHSLRMVFATVSHGSMNEGHAFRLRGQRKIGSKSVPQRLKPSSVRAIYGTAEPVPFVERFPPAWRT